jgi:hypothetical protein
VGDSYTVTVNWGDGSTADVFTGVAPTAHLSFVVDAGVVSDTHTYFDEGGPFTVSVSVTDNTNVATSGDVTSATSGTSYTVTDASLSPDFPGSVPPPSPPGYFTGPTAAGNVVNINAINAVIDADSVNSNASDFETPYAGPPTDQSYIIWPDSSTKDTSLTFAATTTPGVYSVTDHHTFTTTNIPLSGPPFPPIYGVVSGTLHIRDEGGSTLPDQHFTVQVRDFTTTAFESTTTVTAPYGATLKFAVDVTTANPGNGVSTYGSGQPSSGALKITDTSTNTVITNFFGDSYEDTGVIVNGEEQYTITAPALPVGTHVLTVEYLGDGTHASSSTATTLTITVNPDQSVITPVTPAVVPVTAYKNFLYPGPFTANVAFTGNTIPSFIPGGSGASVSFYVSNAPLTTPVVADQIPGAQSEPILGPLDSASLASYTFPTAGTYYITAFYNGDNLDNPAETYSTIADTPAGTPASWKVNVLPNLTTTTITSSSANPALVSQAITFTATVAPVIGGGPALTGTVTFFDDTTGTPVQFGPVVPLAAGSATSGPITYSTAGNYSIEAVYSGDPTYNGSDNSGNLYPETVQPNTTTTVVAAVPSPTVGTAPATVTYTATVTANYGGGTPLGTVSFYNGAATSANLIQTVPLTAGSASTTTSYATANAPAGQLVTAVYNPATGGPITYISSSGTTTEVVLYTATTTFTATPNAAYVGEPVTLTDVVSGAGPAPTGTVTFYENGTSAGDRIGSAQVVARTATLPSAIFSAAGTYTLYAIYSGDPNYSAGPGTTATAESTTETVSLAPTTVSVTSNENPSVVGGAVTFTATVSPRVLGPFTSVTPGGFVNFYDGTTLIAVEPVNGSGVATVTTSVLTPGSHPITAEYLGNGSFSSSTSDALTQIVTTAGVPTTTTLTSSMPLGAQAPATVTLTATVGAAGTPPVGAGTPTGTVTFYITDTTPWTVLTPATGPTAVPLTGGVATITYTFPASGANYDLAAIYSGDATYETSIGDYTQDVYGADVDGTLTSSPNPSAVGQTFTLTAKFVNDPADAVGTPAPVVGTLVDFWDDSVTPNVYLGSSPINAAGVATLTIPAGEPATGTYTFEADYEGDATHYYTEATLDTQSVVKAGTETSLTAEPATATIGQTITFTATVTPTAPASGNPTGTVTFSAEIEGSYTDHHGNVHQYTGHQVLGTGTLVGGVATLNFSPNGFTIDGNVVALTGEYVVSAEYAGDSNYSDSVGQATATVTAASSTTVLVATPATVVYGSPVTLTATVTSPQGTVSAEPTGSVEFFDGFTSLGTAAVDPTGKATISVASLPVGVDDLSAQYSGDPNFTDSTSAEVPVTVSYGSVTANASLISSSPSAVAGQSVTFTSVVTGTAGQAAPIGTVTFSIDGTPVGAPVALTTGTPSVSSSTATVTTVVTPGVHTVTAVYSGDTTYETVSAPSVTETVTSGTATVALSDNSVVSVGVGQPVTFTAAVTAIAPSTDVPTGSVTFTDSSTAPATTLGTVALTSGAAALTVSFPTSGTHTVVASYNGDANFGAVTSANTVSIIVNQPTPTINNVNGITPTSVVEGSGAAAITLLGTGFVPGATVAVNGPSGPTPATNVVVVNSTYITATIPAAETANPGLLVITVTNPGTGGETASVDFNVTIAPISATGTNLNATASVALSSVALATFTDPDTALGSSNFSATIDWADGTNSTGTIVGSNGSFTVDGTHTYLAAGTYSVQINISGADGSSKTVYSNVTVIAPVYNVPAGLSLIGLPYTYTAADPAAMVLGTNAIATWTGGAYAVYPDLPVTNTLTVPGAGYWVRESVDTPVTITGTPVTSPTFTYSLITGWNLISDPYTSPVTWSSVDFNGASLQSAEASGVIGSALFAYNPTPPGAYVSTTTLLPFQGYWIDVTEPVTLTFTNPNP